MLFLVCALAVAALGQVPVTTYHYNNGRTGVNSNETILNTTNIKSGFGRLFTQPVIGQVYAQPLYMPNVTIPGQGVHNVVYIATMHDQVYAFDADSLLTSGSNPWLWHTDFTNSSATPMPIAVCCESRDILPEIGILSTPVIDPSSNLLYLVTETLESNSAVFRLHALNITNGKDVMSTVIQGSVPGTSSDSVNGVLTFNAMQHWQRAGLLLLNGQIYIAFGGHQDLVPYHGWLFSYQASNLKPIGVLCFSPNGQGNGVWQGGVAPAADSSGNIYLETGNGPLDVPSGGTDYGDSLVKIGTSPSGMTILDYFSPSTQVSDQNNDWDFGSSGPVLMPGTTLGLSGGKDGLMYVFNTAIPVQLGGLGKFNATTDQNWQEWHATHSYVGVTPGGFWGGNFIYYNSTLYGFGEWDYLKLWTLSGTLFNEPNPSIQSTIQVPAGVSNDPGMCISANGTTPGTAIVWAAFANTSGNQDENGSPFQGVLHAFDAGSAIDLWNNASDPLWYWSKFNPPIVANGKVYLGTFGDSSSNGGLIVYGLTSTSPGTGSLSGSGTSLSAAVNLTSEGIADWVHWGDSSLNRKSGVTPQISNYTSVGTGTVFTYNNDPRPLSWTDGTPTVSYSNNTNGIYVAAIGNGFSITAPAGTAAQILTVHVGGWNSGGTLTASLSDNSAANFVGTTTTASGSYDGNYTLTYRAGTAGQTLTVTWVMTSGGVNGNVTLNGAALAGASVTATMGTPQSTTVNTAFGTALQATVKDGSNNPISGVTVTFAVPASGASASFAGAATATTNANGVAIAPALTANGTTGTYTVTATATGASPASFSLTNTAQTPASITATAGMSQSTTINTTFGTALQATVLSASNAPVSGVTVTFAVPTSGASASFTGPSTAVTNTSGVATSSPLTANGIAGPYIVTATVSGVTTPANFSLTNTAAVVGTGSLSGSGTSASTAVNLTTEGTADWVHWGDSSLNRKNGVTPQISNYTSVGTGTVLTYNNDPRPMSWTDGTPTASISNNTNGVYVTAIGNGFSITAPAGTATQILTVHVGGWNSGGTLTASLSDNSAANFVGTTTTASGSYDGNYTLTYRAGTAGQTLTVTWVMTSGGVNGNVTLNGAALAGASITATAGTPQSTTVNTAFGTALQATVKDASNNPISGVTVTFAVPASGASASFAGAATATTNASGVAIAPALTANGTTGTYTVTATATGASPASFSLTNLAQVPASITATVGTPQSTTINTAFGTALQATVKDASNTPISGVTVTFAVPTSGASASFTGPATAVTNTSGVAISSSLTANGIAGTYTVTATVSGVAPANFGLTNVAAVVGTGLLSGSGTSASTAVNLTTEGTVDWVHWGDNVLNATALNRKSGVTAQISNYTIVGTGPVQTYNNDPRPMSWTDGSPTASNSSDTNGVYITATGNGFSITVPAGTAAQVLTVHVGGWNSSGTLTAHLSDGSATNYVDTTTSSNTQYDRNYALTYNAASAGQTLTVTWVMTSGSGTGNVTLNGAALSP
jgi:hypothetical protein